VANFAFAYLLSGRFVKDDLMVVSINFDRCINIFQFGSRLSLLTSWLRVFLAMAMRGRDAPARVTIQRRDFGTTLTPFSSTGGGCVPTYR
jgi:hypothetical protein